MTWENSAAISAIETSFAAEPSQPASAEVPLSGAGSVRSGGRRMSMSAPVTAAEGERASETDRRGALKTLLDRAPTPVASQGTGPAPSLVAIFGPPADATETAQDDDHPTIRSGPEAIPAGVSLVSLLAEAAASENET